MTGRRLRIAGLTALAVGCLWVFATMESRRLRPITEILETRATHLAHAERENIARGLIRAEKRTNVDALLLLAVMEEESHFKQRAKGRRGALGLLQIQPATGRDVAQRNRIPWNGEATLFDPSSNLLIGATYLAELRERFGSWDLALTAYNQGPTRARTLAKRGRSPSSKYAARILKRFKSLGPAG